jgi:H+/gluconate symporter-like permease
MENDVPRLELYKMIRSQVEHVDNSLSQRVIWLVIAQSFFFSGYAILINGQPPKPELMPIHDALMNILPIAALLTVIFSFIDVLASILYMKSLRKRYEGIYHEDPDDPFPTVTGSKKERFFMHVSPVLIPVLFIIIWIMLIAIR